VLQFRDQNLGHAGIGIAETWVEIERNEAFDSTAFTPTYFLPRGVLDALLKDHQPDEGPAEVLREAWNDAKRTRDQLLNMFTHPGIRLEAPRPEQEER
jgi:hypothetical protein